MDIWVWIRKTSIKDAAHPCNKSELTLTKEATKNRKQSWRWVYIQGGGYSAVCQSLWQPILIARSFPHAIHNSPLSHAISRTSNIASMSYQASLLRNGRVCFIIKRTSAHTRDLALCLTPPFHNTKRSVYQSSESKIHNSYMLELINPFDA
jgi:hypothetical protein